MAITGTNGKTTVSNTIADILEATGRKVLSNRAGSNMWSGIATTLLAGCTLSGKLREGYDTAVLEVDERSSSRIYPYVQPDVLVVTNLYRDSIKRNGHSEFIFDKIAQALPAETHLLLNGDDMISGLLGEGRNERVFFRVAKTDRSTDTCVNTACDCSACPRCGHLLAFGYFHYHHIGRAHCPECGFTLPEATYEAVDTDFEAGSFMLREPGQANLRLPCKQGSLFSVYNITAAVGCCRMLGLAGADIARALEGPSERTGRFEQQKAGAVNIVTMLRNAGATEVHVRISSPPFKFPCYFGTDIPSGDQLIANHHTIDEIRQLLGADSLGYLDCDRMNEMVKDLEYCDACFTGNYPVDPPTRDIRGDMEV